MSRRLVIVTEIIAPYRIPVFNALAARSDVDLHVMFLSENDPSLREWRVYKDEIRFSYEVLPSWRRRVGKYNVLLNRGIKAALGRANPHAVLCGGYSYLASWQAAAWSGRCGVPLLLWSESTAHDLRRKYAAVEFMKTQFASNCQAFVAAGKSSRDYLRMLGVRDQRIFIAPDAVDVGFYSSTAKKARANADLIRVNHSLPSRYFLCAGRLVEGKGILDLLAAYAELDENIRSRIGLVFAGDGASRQELARRAESIRPGVVKLCGFLQREELAELYALAEALVFPTHSDTWGMVVNEAMSCGLPIISSNVAGCVPDLVEDGANGFVVGPGHVKELTGAMRVLASQPDLVREMGVQSFHKIQSNTPELWAQGVASALGFAWQGL